MPSPCTQCNRRKPWCDRCRKAGSLYENRRRQARARGEKLMVTPYRTIAHILDLRRQGVSLTRISRASGVASESLDRIVNGHRTMINAHTERQVLAVTARVPTLTGTRVPAGPTRTRLRQLAALGYPEHQIAAMLGRSTRTQTGGLRIPGDQVSAGLERRVRELWERIDGAPGPSERTRAHAARKGWLPPAPPAPVDITDHLDWRISLQDLYADMQETRDGRPFDRFLLQLTASRPVEFIRDCEELLGVQRGTLARRLLRVKAAA